MPYLEQSEPEDGCLFCNIAARHEDQRDHIVFRGTQAFVMLNLYPYSSGHLMVVPYQHSGHLDELTAETGAEVFRLSQLAVKSLGEAMKPDGYNLGINQGQVAGAGIADHLHLHVVPRWGGDTNFMPVLADIKVIPELLAATAEKLRPLFQRYGREE